MGLSNSHMSFGRVGPQAAGLLDPDLASRQNIGDGRPASPARLVLVRRRFVARILDASLRCRGAVRRRTSSSTPVVVRHRRHRPAFDAYGPTTGQRRRDDTPCLREKPRKRGSRDPHTSCGFGLVETVDVGVTKSLETIQRQDRLGEFVERNPAGFVVAGRRISSNETNLAWSCHLASISSTCS